MNLSYFVCNQFIALGTPTVKYIEEHYDLLYFVFGNFFYYAGNYLESYQYPEADYFLTDASKTSMIVSQIQEFYKKQVEQFSLSVTKVFNSVVSIESQQFHMNLLKFKGFMQKGYNLEDNKLMILVLIFNTEQFHAQRSSTEEFKKLIIKYNDLLKNNPTTSSTFIATVLKIMESFQ